MIKSTAVVLGFLFGLSTAYYLSFWGFFGIDIFQYIAIEDIIKGIAYPLRLAGVWILGLFAFFVFMVTVLGIDAKDNWPKSARKPLVIFAIIAVIMIIVYYFLSNNILAGMTLSIVLSMLLVTGYFAVNSVHNSRADGSEHPVLKFLNILLIYATIFLPINSIVTGQVEARAIHDNIRYNYIMKSDLESVKIKISQPYLIFLGAVSEKYVLMDKEQHELFIIDKSELPALKIQRFNQADESSIVHLEACIERQMTALKVK
jgi:hypothetical protein